ncbi:LrgB-like family-domain-containing protein, partial [Baffinella frigidus]
MRTNRAMRSHFLSLLVLALLAIAAAQTDGGPAPPKDTAAPGEPAAAPQPPPPSPPPAPPPPPPAPPPPPKRAQPSAPKSAPKKGMPVMSLKKILPKGMTLRAAGVDAIEQTDVLLEALPSLLAFMGSNLVFKHVMREVLGITKFPHALVGMFVFFGGMCAMKPSDADKVVTFFKPGLDILTAFLPAFFAPGLVLTPLAATGISSLDLSKFLGILSVNLFVLYGTVGSVVAYLQKLSGMPIPAGLPPSNNKYKAWFSPALEKIFFASTFATMGGQTFFFSQTFFSFIFASRLPEASFMNPTFAQYWHPLLTTYVTSTALVGGFGMIRGMSLNNVLSRFMVSGGSPLASAGTLIMMFLEPAIISFSFGLYARRQLLRENALAILGGAFTASFFGIFSSAFFCRIVNPSRPLKLALIPRATAALAVVQAAMIGGPVPLTTVNCCLIGILGANFGPKYMDFLGLRSPVARGVATGGAGLALASAGLAASDPASFPFGALSMAITSTMSTILLSFTP